MPQQTDDLAFVQNEELIRELNKRFSSFVIIFERDLPSTNDQLKRSTDMICSKCTPAHVMGLIEFGSILNKQRVFEQITIDSEGIDE